MSVTVASKSIYRHSMLVTVLQPDFLIFEFWGWGEEGYHRASLSHSAPDYE